MSTPAGSSDPDQTRRDIQRTRAELGETVAALAAKTDVKAQVGTKVTTAADGLRQRADRVGQSARTTAVQLTRTVTQKTSQRVTAIQQKAQHSADAVRSLMRASPQTTAKADSTLVTSVRAATTRIGMKVRTKPVPVLAAAGTVGALAVLAYRRRRSR
ncbi:DUF3618 domain-containing protein [Micromonospora psammae]|uniref:DUF3618 domain-containing protein n=1 Tax=Micromonospora sp. CPCC 205556 TaxID=3122398 RepID=UPI002FF0D9D3